MSTYRMTLACPAGCPWTVSLNDSDYPDEHDEHRTVTAMAEHLAAEHPDYVDGLLRARVASDYRATLRPPVASVFDSTEDALHIARWDPVRVLAECEAKRRITLKITALPYADHPDWRQEWRP